MKRVLIMNDSQELLELMKAILEEEGYEVVISSYAIEELSEIERIKPDLIILDYMIGAMQPKGWNTLQKLKLFRPTMSIPVIMCTAAEKAVLEQEGYLTSKGITVVLKPFDIDNLIEAVTKAFPNIQHSAQEHKMKSE
jgi:CheY-like chemotaxis protein